MDIQLSDILIERGMKLKKEKEKTLVHVFFIVTVVPMMSKCLKSSHFDLQMI